MTIEANENEVWVRCGSSDGSVMCVTSESIDHITFTVYPPDDKPGDPTEIRISKIETLGLAKILEHFAQMPVDEIALADG